MAVAALVIAFLTWAIFTSDRDPGNARLLLEFASLNLGLPALAGVVFARRPL